MCLLLLPEHRGTDGPKKSHQVLSFHIFIDLVHSRMCIQMGIIGSQDYSNTFTGDENEKEIEIYTHSYRF